MFGVPAWDDEARDRLDADVWSLMKAAIDRRAEEAKKKPKQP